MIERPRRDVEIGGAPHVLIDVWRSPTGLGLGYFLGPDPSADRRAVLDSETDVGEMGDDEAAALWAAGVPLTPTERRFVGGDGEVWLAQATGPVWGHGAAPGILGLRLVCLTADRPRVEVSATTLNELEDDDLVRLVGSATDIASHDDA